MEEQGLQTATADQIMLGITKASLATDSFLSAASFRGDPFQTSNPFSIFVSSTQVEDGTRLLGLIVRGQNGLTVATQVQ